MSPDVPQSAPLSTSDPALARRNLLRGGAILAGATLAAAAAQQPASAADGETFTLGESNEAESTTTLRVGGTAGGADPTLSLTNAAGPSLFLNPLAADWNGQLAVGQVANTTAGPLIGIDVGGQARTTRVVTEQSLWQPFVVPPIRLLDTRSAEGRVRIALPSPLQGVRLPANRELTFWIAPSGQGFAIPAVFLNITVVGGNRRGNLTVYPGPDLPPTSTINFAARQTVANGTFIGTSIEKVSVVFGQGQQPQQVEAHVVKVRATAPVAVIIDATGAFATGFVPVQQSARADRGRNNSPVDAARKNLGRLRSR